MFEIDPDPFDNFPTGQNPDLLGEILGMNLEDLDQINSQMVGNFAAQFCTTVISPGPDRFDDRLFETMLGIDEDSIEPQINGNFGAQSSESEKSTVQQASFESLVTKAVNNLQNTIATLEHSFDDDSTEPQISGNLVTQSDATETAIEHQATGNLVTVENETL